MGKLLHRGWLASAALGTVAAAAVLVYFLLRTIAPPPQEMKAGGATHPNADWTVEPHRAGPQLPPVGRSLFDHLMTARRDGATVYDVPFPFSALIARIEQQLQRDGQHPSPVKKVLIPLGRSLQRDAAAPDYFSYPRAVAAVDGEPREQPEEAGMLLKDRLYLGYQEKADLIEVISYNESAGRFEFQVVKNYRRGARPQVFYANRVLCISCHRNHAPIFSRQTWDETNAAPEVRRRLGSQGKDFYRFPIQGGVDIPNAIDDATDRANLFAASQRLWREGCEDGASGATAARCRARLFTFMLQLRLSGGRFFDRESNDYRKEFLPAFAQRWRQRWPRGLAVPDPDIPNRTVFSRSRFAAEDAEVIAQAADVADRFDPLNPRPPMSTWQVNDHDRRAVDYAVVGLAEFVTAADIRRLDRHLSSQPRAAVAARREYPGSCEFTAVGRTAVPGGLEFRCAGSEIDLRGRLNLGTGGGSVDRLAVSGNVVLHSLELGPSALEGRVDGQSVTLALRADAAKLRPRLPDGNSLDAIRLSWDGEVGRSLTVSGRAGVSVLDDFAPLRAAVDRMAQQTIDGVADFFAAKPFRRTVLLKALFNELGMPPLSWCCEEGRDLPAAVADVPQSWPRDMEDAGGRGTDGTMAKFQRHCASCHAMAEASPANFLYGDREQIAANLNHCAERLFFRLEMARLAPGQRPKSPMPPSSGGAFESTAERRSEIEELAEFADRRLRAETGRAPNIEELMTRGYWNLRSCLPADLRQAQAPAVELPPVPRYDVGDFSRIRSNAHPELEP